MGFFSTKKTQTEIMLDVLSTHIGYKMPTSQFSELGIRGYIKIKNTLRNRGHVIDTIYEKKRDKDTGKIRTMKVFYVYRGYNPMTRPHIKKSLHLLVEDGLNIAQHVYKKIIEYSMKKGLPPSMHMLFEDAHTEELSKFILNPEYMLDDGETEMLQERCSEIQESERTKEQQEIDRIF